MPGSPSGSRTASGIFCSDGRGTVRSDQSACKNLICSFAQGPKRARRAAALAAGPDAGKTAAALKSGGCYSGDSQKAQGLAPGVQARLPPDGEDGVPGPVAEIAAIGHRNAPALPQAPEQVQQGRWNRVRVVAEEQAGHLLHQRMLFDIAQEYAGVRHAVEALGLLKEEDVLFVPGEGEVGTAQGQGKIHQISAQQAALAAPPRRRCATGRRGCGRRGRRGGNGR